MLLRASGPSNDAHPVLDRAGQLLHAATSRRSSDVYCAGSSLPHSTRHDRARPGGMRRVRATRSPSDSDALGALWRNISIIVATRKPNALDSADPCIQISLSTTAYADAGKAASPTVPGHSTARRAVHNLNRSITAGQLVDLSNDLGNVFGNIEQSRPAAHDRDDSAREPGGRSSQPSHDVSDVRIGTIHRRLPGAPKGPCR